MKVSAAKVLLVASMGVYGYSLRDQFSEPQKIPGAAPAAAKELTSAIVNETVALSCPRDPFTGASIKGGERKRIISVAKAVKPLGPMALQGVSVGPEIRLAIINGVTLKEGEPQTLEDGGPVVCARTIGLDYAIVRAGGRDVLLRLEQPKSQKEYEAAAAKADARADAKASPGRESQPEAPATGGTSAKEDDVQTQVKRVVQQLQQMK